jgi:hypothetical protein
MTFPIQINTTTIGKLSSYLPNALFSPMLMSHHLGMDKFEVLSLMTNITMSLLEIPLVAHVYILLQCWQVLSAAMGCMCNVNMCIPYYSWLCYVGSWKSSFIIVHGVGMKFSVYWRTLKPLNSTDHKSIVDTLQCMAISIEIAQQCKHANTSRKGPFCKWFL